jgi:hypothetical protein
MSPVKKGVIFFFLIMAIWAGVFVLIYYNTNPSSGTASSTTPTQTTTTTTTPTTTPQTTTQTTPTLTPDELAYIEAISDYDSSAISAANTLKTLLTAPQIGDADWTQQVSDQIEAIALLYAEISQLSLPSSMLNIHYQYLFAMGYYNSAIEIAIQGVNEANTYSIALAVTYLDTGIELRNEAVSLLNEFIAAHSQ